MNAVVHESEAAVPAVVPDETRTILEMILRAAKDPATEIEKAERLMAMYERQVEKNAEMAFNAAMTAAQIEMPKVLRNRENNEKGSRYADLERVNEIVVPIYTKHGFSLSFSTADSPLPGHYRVTCLVSHSGGHSRTYPGDVPSDLTGPKGTPNKTGTQAFGSTMSYGRRYLTLLIFNISLTNEDDDGRAAGGIQLISEDQVRELRALIKDVGANESQLLKYIKADRIESIATASFDMVSSIVEAKRPKRK